MTQTVRSENRWCPSSEAAPGTPAAAGLAPSEMGKESVMEMPAGSGESRSMERPHGLGDAGSAFFDQIAAKYILREDEERILENVCRELDHIARIEQALDGADLVVAGSRGQLSAHPLLASLAQHRTLLARLVRQLDLPNDDGVPAHRSALSEKRSRAAHTRWDRQRALRAAAEQGL